MPLLFGVYSFFLSPWAVLSCVFCTFLIMCLVTSMVLYLVLVMCHYGSVVLLCLCDCLSLWFCVSVVLVSKFFSSTVLLMFVHVT